MNIPAPLAALSLAALIAGPAFAQATSTTTVIENGRGQPIAVVGTTAAAPVANPSTATTPPTTANADTGYTANVQGPAFRDVDARIAAASAKVGHNRRAAAMLSKIKGEARYRRARHGGELRDWDRELLNKQLDQLDAMMG